MRRLVACALAGLALMAAACSEDETTVPAVSVMPTDAEFTVTAEGELIASESLPISLPGSIRMAFNIAWLAPEFSEVKKGEVVARFDDVQVQLDREDTFLEVARSEFELAGLARAEELERTRIDHESVRVEGERDITETFEDVDERLFSRNEIIDALSDLDYLDVQSDFLEWQFDTFDQRTEAEKNAILARREGELDKLEKQDTALAMMELRSPADGTFIYARTPWGRKLAKGQTVHPGRPVGLLPVRGKVKARIYVPEADAVGLAKGQTVRFRLDAASDSEFSARVEAVSPVASPRDRDDPRKFFSVDAAIDDVDPDLMRVGSRIRARIITGRIEDGFVVPAQSIYGNSRDAYVYVVDGSGTERREVTLGLRSPDRVEITSGLEQGERISLVPPPDAG